MIDEAQHDLGPVHVLVIFERPETIEKATTRDRHHELPFRFDGSRGLLRHERAELDGRRWVAVE